VVNGKTAGSDINLYKLFTEQCFNLLRAGGHCGIVIPSGIYTDLGTKQLREMLFGKAVITGLFGFENRKTIFENVDSRFKFVTLTFRKGGHTTSFPAAFMRHDVSELASFPRKGAILVSVSMIRRFAPGSLAVPELRSASDESALAKINRFPSLGEWLEGHALEFSREFMSSDDHPRFNSIGDGATIYEGKMIEQFDHAFTKPKWWISESALRRTHFYNKGDWKEYRFAIRRVASNTNYRTLIAAILPKNSLVVHSLFVNVNDILGARDALYLVAALNSCVCDFAIRNQVTSNVTQFALHRLPVPRLFETDKFFTQIVDYAARLTCTQANMHRTGVRRTRTCGRVDRARGRSHRPSGASEDPGRA
jgi:hypothetical protein